MLIDALTFVVSLVSLASLRGIARPACRTGRPGVSWAALRRETGALGGNRRPVFAAAGVLTVITAAGAWIVAIRKEDASSAALPLLAGR